MRRNNTSNQTSVLDNVFSGFTNLFGPPNTGASRNTNRNGCESRAPIPNYHSPYSPYSPITQTNLRNQGQKPNQCFHSDSTLGWLFGGGNFVSLPTSNKPSYFDVDGKPLTPDEITKIHNKTPSTIFYLDDDNYAYNYDHNYNFSNLVVRRSIIHC